MANLTNIEILMDASNPKINNPDDPYWSNCCHLLQNMPFCKTLFIKNQTIDIFQILNMNLDPDKISNFEKIFYEGHENGYFSEQTITGFKKFKNLRALSLNVNKTKSQYQINYNCGINYKYGEDQIKF